MALVTAKRHLRLPPPLEKQASCHIIRSMLFPVWSAIPFALMVDSVAFLPVAAPQVVG